MRAQAPPYSTCDPPPVLGERGRTQLGPGWLVFESHQPAGLEASGHEHARLSLCAVLEGSFVEDDGTRFGAGELGLTPAGHNPSLLFGPSGAHCLLIEVDEDLWSDSGAGAEVPEVMRVERDSAVLGSLARLRAELFAAEAASDAVESALFDLVIELARRRGARSEAVAGSPLGRALEAIHDGYRQSLTLSRIAALVGLHRMTLARGFRAAFGISVGDYLHRLRVSYACHLIERGIPLATVAVESGFSDQSHLNRIFRRIVGRTPGGFRRLVC